MPDSPLSGLREVLQSAKGNSVPSLLNLLRQFLGRLPLEQLMGFLQNKRTGIERDMDLIEKIAQREKVQSNPDLMEDLQQVATVLGFQLWVLSHPQVLFNSGEREFCFGGSARPDELLDFMVWQHQADKLGITLTDADLVKEINIFAAGQEVFDPEKTRSLDRDKQIIEFVKGRERGQTPPSELVDALREEFRVVMAQGLLVGSEPGIRAYRSLLGAAASPSAGTPDEFFRYYREQRTTLRVKMLSLSVADFVSKVKSTPSEEELRNRYERYKEQEPSSTSREPGFKEPRRITVEYVSASPDDAFYRDAARSQALLWKRYGDPPTRAASSFGLLVNRGYHRPVRRRDGRDRSLPGRIRKIRQGAIVLDLRQ